MRNQTLGWQMAQGGNMNFGRPAWWSWTTNVVNTREIYPLDPQPHRHCMLAPRASAPRVTRCSLGKYWSHDFFQKEAESSRQGVGNPEPYLFSLPLSRSDRLPRRWGQQAARLGYTGYLWLIVGGSEIWWCMHSAHSLSSYSQLTPEKYIPLIRNPIGTAC